MILLKHFFSTCYLEQISLVPVYAALFSDILSITFIFNCFISLRSFVYIILHPRLLLSSVSCSSMTVSQNRVIFFTGLSINAEIRREIWLFTHGLYSGMFVKPHVMYWPQLPSAVLGQSEPPGTRSGVIVL